MICNDSLSLFIKENYDICLKGETVDEALSNVEEFLLADLHYSAGYNRVNSLFINLFANDKDLIMVEMKSFGELFSPKDSLQSISLETTGKITGWDDQDFIKKIYEGQDLLKHYAAIEMKMREVFHELSKVDLQGSKNVLEKQVVCYLKEMSRASGIFRLCQSLKGIMPLILETFQARQEKLVEALIISSQMAKRRFLIA